MGKGGGGGGGSGKACGNRAGSRASPQGNSSLLLTGNCEILFLHPLTPVPPPTHLTPPHNRQLLSSENCKSKVNFHAAYTTADSVTESEGKSGVADYNRFPVKVNCLYRSQLFSQGGYWPFDGRNQCIYHRLRELFAMSQSIL